MRSEVTLKSKSMSTKGNRRGSAWIVEISYEPIVLMKVENRRAPVIGRPRYPLEGRGEQLNVSARRHLCETLNSRWQVKRP
jgi:hypothetical protein